MRQPLIFARIDVEFGAEGMRVLLPLGARVDERALVMAERATVEIALDEIRAHERPQRSEEHTSELQSLMRISSAVFCLKKKNNTVDLNTRSIHTTRHTIH